MKTKLISLLLSCVLLLSLAACAKEGSGSDETTKETTPQTTEEATTQTDTTVEETTAPTGELALNADLLSDIGLTYPQLVEKHGPKIDAKFSKLDGSGLEYTFENGYGAYVWGYDDLDYGRETTPGEWTLYSEIDESVMLPKIEVPCKYVLIQAKDLLLNATFPLDASSIKGIHGINNYRTGEDHISTPYSYYFAFFFNGIEISIYCNDPEIIDADSYTEIHLLK